MTKVCVAVGMALTATHGQKIKLKRSPNGVNVYSSMWIPHQPFLDDFPLVYPRALGYLVTSGP
jgi:hypothetical protein